MTWRYQPVYIDHVHPGGETERIYTLTSVYLSKDGSLKAWPDDKTEFAPQGVDSAAELQSDCLNMLVASLRWEPVALDELKVGMVFERAASTVEPTEVVEKLKKLLVELSI